MITLPDQQTENIIEFTWCSDTKVEKEKSLETEDYNLAKMRIVLESISSDRKSIPKTLKDENRRKLKEQNMFI